MQHVFGTVTVVTEENTDIAETLTDLLNAYALVGFSGGWTETELKLIANTVIENQYFEAIMNSQTHELPS